MDNSSTIGFALITGFIVYITVRGELPAYLCVVGLGNGCPTPPSDPQGQQQKPPITQNSTITAPHGAGNPPTNIPVFSTITGGGDGEGGPVLPPPSFPFPPGWNLSPLPAPTFPTPPGNVFSTFYCEDPYGNPIPCQDTSGGATCYDENGDQVSCD